MFGYKSIMQVPKVAAIVINIGLGEAKENSKAIEAATGDKIENTLYEVLVDSYIVGKNLDLNYALILVKGILVQLSITFAIS